MFRIRRRALGLVAVALAIASWRLIPLAAAPPAASPPRLLVLVVVDQMRWDYLDYYKDRIHLGFDRLLKGGAVFSQARYPYAKTETAQGHTLMVTGQTPSVAGITGDQWYDRTTKATVAAGESRVHHLAASTAAGGSPEQLLVPTVGDVMKIRDPATLVLTASWKRYAAELTGGHHADAAYWFDAATGHMVTSDYYLRAYPAWVQTFDRTDLTAPYAGKTWLTHALLPDGAIDDKFRNAVRDTPFANDILLAFVKRMLASTALGRDGTTDLLVVSFSALDYVGHKYGAHSPELDAMFVEQDRQLGELLQMLDDAVGKDQWTVAMTADHGVALPPDQVRAAGGDAGIINVTAYRAALRKALAGEFPNPDKLIATTSGPDIYLDYAEAASRKIDPAALERAVAAAGRAQPGIAAVYTREQILSAAGTSDPMLARIALSYFAPRSGDLYALVKPNWYFSTSAHGAPYEYDLHVPLIFYGHGIVPGRFDRDVLTLDLAPTLAHIAGVVLPGVPGKPLVEALQK